MVLLGCLVGWWRRPQSPSLCKRLWMVINVWPTYATSLMNCYSNNGAFLSSLRQQKAKLWVAVGESRDLWTILVFYHLLAFVKRRVSRPWSAASPQHVPPPLQGSLQAVSDTNTHGLLHSFSASSTSHIYLADGSMRIPTLVPGTLTFSKPD